MKDQDGSYRAERVVDAPRARVFEALTTLEGLAGWWTPAVSGSSGERGQIVLAFDEQRLMMRVDSAVAPESVRWTCTEHTRFPEWRGTILAFDLRERGDDTTVLRFRHGGLVPDLQCFSVCRRGWDHYLSSLCDEAAGRGGNPYGSEAHARISPTAQLRAT